MATQDKYDRQLRMWGTDGQQRLNKSNVLCLGLTAAGTETLKNLVLPGLGYIRIVSADEVSHRTLSSNFFADPEDIGKPLAVSVMNNLLELNPDVRGEAVVQHPHQFFEQQVEPGSSGVLLSATLVLCDNLDFVD
jgi:NEDD8-activating enzyme E1 regulatory subunit